MNDVTISLGKILMCGVPLLLDNTEKAREIYKETGRENIAELNIQDSNVCEIISHGLSEDFGAIIVKNLQLLDDHAQINLANCLHVSDVRFKRKFIFQTDEFNQIKWVLSRELYKYKFTKLSFYDLIFPKLLPIKT